MPDQLQAILGPPVVDIVAILLLSIAAVPLVEFTSGLPRIVLGMIALLVFPGYALTVALFPAKNDLGRVERVGWTIALSFAMISLAGVALNYTPWGITLTPVVISTLILIFVPAAIALFRRARLDKSERSSPSPSIRRSLVLPSGRFDRILYLSLAMVVLASVSTLAYVIIRPKTEAGFTNFYLLGELGKMEGYPRQMVIGDEAAVTLGITNHERQPVTYTAQVVFDGNLTQTLGPIELADNADWSALVALRPSRVGNNQQVEFLLYKDQETDPYRLLRLWVDVTR
jgi:uncharacterized membrane protein